MASHSSSSMDRRHFLRAAAGVVGAGVAVASAEAAPAPAGTTFSLKREIPVWEGFDVVVAGGGPAGASAAIAASRLGAKVLLVEAMGCFGGMGSSGLVCAFDPMGNGDTNVVRGIMREVVLECAKAGFLKDNDAETQLAKYLYWTPFRPEGYKLVLDRLVNGAGVTSRFFTKVIDADADPATGTVRGVVIQNISGYRYVPARMFIDCTGDAVVADLVGAKYRLAGRDTPQINPPTVAMNWAGDIPEARDTLWKAYKTSYKDTNYFPWPDPMLVGLSVIGDNIGYLNGGHLFGCDAINDAHVVRAMMQGREIADGFRRLMQDHLARAEGEIKHVELITTAALLGVRETRRIVGEYELNEQDLVSRRIFPDAIGVYCKFSDIHLYEPTAEAYQAHLDLKKRTSPGKGNVCAIPYGTLVPKGWKNFWVAGRSICTDLVAGGAIRVQPFCSMMGQAAGTAAVQAMKTGQAANRLNTATLVETLREQGVYLPQPSTSEEMTRA